MNEVVTGGLLPLVHVRITLLYHIIYNDFNTVSSDGTITYSEVRIFLEKRADGILEFKSITTYLDQTLTLTGNHLVYARKTCNDKFNPM